MAKLTESDRVDLIDDICEPLKVMDAGRAGMILRQFLGVEKVEDFRHSGFSSQYEWIVDVIEVAEDDILLSLARHFDDVEEEIRLPASTETSASRDEEGVGWEPNHFRIFISHLAAHRDVAGDIKNALLPYGISAFVAHDDIEPTTEWLRVIRSALATCHWMLVLLHPGFRESEWADQEVGYAICRNLVIMPVKYEGDPHGFMRGIQALDGRSKSTKTIAESIFDAICRNPDTRKDIAIKVARLFAQSTAFDRVPRMSVLEKLQYWDDSITHITRSAAKEKDHIYNEWGVPRRLDVLINKWALRTADGPGSTSS